MQQINLANVTYYMSSNLLKMENKPDLSRSRRDDSESVESSEKY